MVKKKAKQAKKKKTGKHNSNTVEQLFKGDLSSVKRAIN